MAVDSAANGFMQMSNFFTQQKQSAMQREMAQMQMDNYRTPEQRAELERTGYEDRAAFNRKFTSTMADEDRARNADLINKAYPGGLPLGKMTDPITGLLVNDDMAIFNEQRRIRIEDATTNERGAKETKYKDALDILENALMQEGMGQIETSSVPQDVLDMAVYYVQSNELGKALSLVKSGPMQQEADLARFAVDVPTDYMGGTMSMVDVAQDIVANGIKNRKSAKEIEDELDNLYADLKKQGVAPQGEDYITEVADPWARIASKVGRFAAKVLGGISSQRPSTPGIGGGPR